MSEYVNTHALERSVRRLSTGGVLALDAARQAQGYDQLEEIECQIQIPIFGIARSGAGWSKFSISFDVDFMFAPEQRDSPLAVPHFAYGPVVAGVPYPDGHDPDPNNPDSQVAIFCSVLEWGKDGALDAIIGAVVGIGVSTIGGSVDVKFEGYVHLVFQGYATVNEDPPDISVGAQS